MTSVQGIKTIFDNEVFSKGMINSFGDLQMPSSHTPYCRNIRIKNGSMTIRKGFDSIIASNAGTKVQGMATNHLNNKLYVVFNKLLYSVNFTTGAYSSSIGTVSTTDTAVNMVTYDKYTIICNGEDYPYLYDGTTLSQLGSGQITASSNAVFGASFADFTMLAGSGTYANQLFISKPIVATAITDCYDYVDATADIRTMKSNILGISSTMNRLVVFCEDSIEYLDRSTVATVGGKSVFYTKPIGQGDKLASHRSIVAAGDKIFFLTKDNKIKTVDYVQGISDLSIGELSDMEGQSISLFMQGLDTDQSESFGYYNKTEGLIKWFLKTNGALFNDICLIYDLINTTWLVDDNKYFACAAEFNKNYYCGGDINSNLFQDETGYDDDGEGIAWDRWSSDNPIGNPQARKSVRGVGINGQINSLGSFNMEVYVNGEKVTDTQTISGTGIVPGSLTAGVIGGDAIGAEAIGGDPIQQSVLTLVPFNWKLSKSKLRFKGLRIQTRYYGNTKNTILSLDSQSIDFRPVGDIQMSKKL